MRVRVGEIKTVLVVETDLMLDENDKGYDRAALTEMLNALKTIEAHHGWRDLASNTHLRGDVRCRALLRGVKSAVAKTLLSMPDLRYRALAEIRMQPGCSNVQGIAINRVSDQHAENNWSLCVSSAGTADANTAARAALHVQSVLRRDYDLMPD